MPPTVSRDLLTNKEAAEHIGCTEKTLEAWRSSGRHSIPYIKITSKMIRYRRADLDRFLESKTVSPRTLSPEKL